MPEAEDFEPYRNLRGALSRGKKSIMSLGGLMDRTMKSGNEPTPGARRSDVENAAARRRSQSAETDQQNATAMRRSPAQRLKDRALSSGSKEKSGFGLKRTARSFLGGY